MSKSPFTCRFMICQRRIAMLHHLFNLFIAYLYIASGDSRFFILVLLTGKELGSSAGVHLGACVRLGADISSYFINSWKYTMKCWHDLSRTTVWYRRGRLYRTRRECKRTGVSTRTRHVDLRQRFVVRRNIRQSGHQVTRGKMQRLQKITSWSERSSCKKQKKQHSPFSRISALETVAVLYFRPFHTFPALSVISATEQTRYSHSQSTNTRQLVTFTVMFPPVETSQRGKSIIVCARIIFSLLRKGSYLLWRLRYVQSEFLLLHLVFTFPSALALPVSTSGIILIITSCHVFPFARRFLPAVLVPARRLFVLVFVLACKIK